MNTFLRQHEISIWNLKFRLSKKFRFKNRKESNIYTNKLIVDHEPTVYKRFEDDYNREKLLIKVSWTILVFACSFLLVFIAFLFLNHPNLSYMLTAISVILFTTGMYLKRQYLCFAFNIDLTRELLTDDIITQVKKDLQSTPDSK